MQLDVQWEEPKKVRVGSVAQWRRQWLIPVEFRGGFFDFWKRNKFKLLADGFSVYKKDNDWYLTETKFSCEQFLNFSSPKSELPKYEFIELPFYDVQIKDGLRDWQVNAVSKLVSAIKKWDAAIDGSDTGVGKTYNSCAVARELGMKIMVVCPKAIIKKWEKVIKNHFKMKDDLIGVTNYEQLKIGKTDSPIASFVTDRQTRRDKFIWKIPKNTLIIWDEAQKLKNWNTKNSKTCIAAYKQGYKQLFCTATMASNPLELRTVGTVLKMFKSYYPWAYDHGVYRGRFGLEFNDDKDVLKRLHSYLFKERGVRLRRDTIPGFPDSEIIAEVYNMDDEDVLKINQIYRDMEKELSKLTKRQKQDGESELIIRLRARQRIELVKVPLFVEMIEEGVNDGMSVVCFVNFTETINAIAKRVGTDCIFDGKNEKTRDDSVNRFQEDKERVILVNIMSGGSGLDLHDLNGNYPRLSLISPNDSPFLMRQSVGRVWRDDAKTKSIQKILFVANTVEEDVCKNVQRKLNNLDLLNDGDLLYAKNYEIVSD
jgi:superfamily II DNA or RNA helicase